ncbi:MAG: phospholipid carrier-dependent glycosyltransferase [Bdellovibrionales bacterium]|nr:phospholipid carrier-dependent glycosyltransferase [Bdellovibrionales bacterium]
MPDQKAFLVTSVALFFGFWTLFILYIQFPQGLNFDEFHYVPAARQWLSWAENRNYEHPPLAKQLIALSMAIFGDQPLGWRFMSTVFGALTITGTYVAALALFRTQLAALFTALITGFNCMVYVQSRIAMLDTFMMGFLIWAMALGLCAFFPLFPDLSPESEHRRRLKNLNLSGVALGLACACKWFSVIPWLSLGAIAGIYQLFRSWGITFGRSTVKSELAEFYPLPPTGIPLSRFIRAWISIPVLVYFSTFIPFLWITTNATGHTYSIKDILFSNQLRMWTGQLNVVSPHPYSSTWTQWPLMSRPIWYAFEPSPDKQWVRGVLFICNPVVIWAGLLAMLWTFFDWLWSRTFAALWISATYATLTFSWMLIPRKLAFFYYYYPAGILLSFAWTYMLHCLFRNSSRPSRSSRASLIAHLVVLALTLGFFIYFFPILSAWKIPNNSYDRWMWFRSWI